MPEISVEIEVSCTCGQDLSARVSGGTSITVEPCDRCLNDRGDAEYEKGFEAGQRE